MNKIILNNNVKTPKTEHKEIIKKHFILKSLDFIDDESSNNESSNTKSMSKMEKTNATDNITSSTNEVIAPTKTYIGKKRGRPKTKGENRDNKSNDTNSTNSGDKLQEEQDISKEIEIIDKIINLFPELKKKRNYILNELITPKKKEEINYVLERIEVNGEVYYKDKYKCILNSNIEIVGICEQMNEKQEYHIFKDEVGKIENLDKKFSIDDDLNKEFTVDDDFIG